MTRHHDWPERLAAAIEAARHRPFVWGEHDCCLWVSDAIDAMTGTDPAADIRGRYRDEAGAAAIIAQSGAWPWAIDRAACAVGISRIAVTSAGRGDVVLVRQGDQVQPTICVGDHLAAAGPDGLIFLPRSLGIGAWRV